jgi:hypothetical protein
MPYITKAKRHKLDPIIAQLGVKLRCEPNYEGELNYIISRLIGLLFDTEPRYASIARITGVLENVKQEFYRRLAAPYEDCAVAKNGDLPEYSHRKGK